MKNSKRQKSAGGFGREKPMNQIMPVPETAISTSSFYLLKWIACITMLIDHIALFFRVQCDIPDDTYWIMRCVGRIAFPLFAYLLVESFHHTQHRGKSLLKIGMIALISEIPFDVVNISRMPIGGDILNLNYQNVCFTLFLSYLLLMATDISYNKVKALYNNSKFGTMVEASVKVVILGIAMVEVQLLNASFGYGGVLFIFLLNFARGRKHKSIYQAFAFLIFGLTQAHIEYLFIIISFVLLMLVQCKAKRNGSEKENMCLRFLRSKFSRTFTRIFYPLHLIILVLVRTVMVL